MKKLEIDCNKCKHCTGYGCVKYGDNAEVAVKQCANDGFIHYSLEVLKEVEIQHGK